MNGDPRWTREVAKSGPGDTFLGRYRVERLGSSWIARDLVTGQTTADNRGGRFPTMRDARAFAELCRGGLA